MKILETNGGVALLAGFGCYFLAFGLVILAPIILTDAKVPTVIDVNGERVDVPAYTEQEAAGRDVYINQLCWHCHSQFVRPVNQEEDRYGPVSQAGESAIDQPHLFGTRRTGPDLAREAWLRIDDWHLAHLYDPRSTVAGSVMPGFTWLFDANPYRDSVLGLLDQIDLDGDGIRTAYDALLWSDPRFSPQDLLDEARGSLADWRGEPYPKTRMSDTGVEVRDGTYEDVYTEEMKGDGLLSDYDAGWLPGDRASDLVAYLQRLGRAIGPFRQPIYASAPFRPTVPSRGVEVPWTTPDGAALTLSVGAGEMPLRARAARRYGLARTKATPEELAAADDLQAQYDALMGAWRAANPAWSERLDQGKALYERHCASCHGDEGRGNGDAAAFLEVRPRDFTVAKYRYRSTQVGTLPLDGDLYRSIYRGLWGSSMPSWRQLGENDLWLLVDYVKSFQERNGVTNDIGRGQAGTFNLHSLALDVPTQPPVPEEDLAEHLERGKAVYLAMKCYNCHGMGRGDGPGWNETKQDNGGILRPRDFQPRGPHDVPALRYRGGASAEDIYRTIFTGLDGGNMPSSLGDFDGAWKAADQLARLEADGAPAEQIEAARRTARRKLYFPYGADAEGNPVPDRVLPGVVQELDENGKVVAEYISELRQTVVGRGARPGDDWALVHYVMSLSGIPIPTVK